MFALFIPLLVIIEVIRNNFAVRSVTLRKLLCCKHALTVLFDHLNVVHLTTLSFYYRNAFIFFFDNVLNGDIKQISNRRNKSNVHFLLSFSCFDLLIILS